MIGLDLAKSVFQVHGIDAAGRVVVRRTLKRAQVLRFFGALPLCTVALEACGTAQAIGRSFDIIFPGRHRAAHRAVFERLSRGEATKLAGQVLEMMAVHHGGHEFPIEMSLAARREAGTYASGARVA